MDVVITLIHVIACVALIVIVLLQQGKGANMGAAFGGSSQTVFGSGGATPFLGKVTTIVAVVFMLTSLTLAFFSGPMKLGSSVVDQGASQEAPAGSAPAQTAPAQSGESQEKPASE